MTDFQIKMHFILVSMRYVRDSREGICGNIDVEDGGLLSFGFMCRSRDWLGLTFKKWTDYSGHPLYPVPSPKKFEHPCVAFTDAENMWTGAYGEKRKELLEFLIKEIQKDE